MNIIANLTNDRVFELPSVCLTEAALIPPVRCIYFVASGQVIVYIGKSVSLAGRWKNHHRALQILEQYPSARVHWLEIEASEDELLELEQFAINKFKPLLNGSPSFLQTTRITSAEFGDFNYQQYLEWIFVEGQGKSEHVRNLAVARTEANRPRTIEGLNHYAKVYGLSVEDLSKRIRELDAQKKTILQIHRILQEERG